MPPPKATPLTHKQQAFVRAYVRKCNGAEAAREAGYSDHSAREIAYQLLRRPAVLAAIRLHQETDEKLTGGYRHYVRNGFKELADRGLGAKATAPQVAAAVRSLEQLGKLEGLYPREGIDVRVQGALEELVAGVRPLMPPQSYADLLTALAEVTGVTRMAPEADAGSGPAPVH